MPIVDRSSYRAPIYLRNSHLQTIFASLARKVGGVNYSRHRIDTWDGDFIDLDFSSVGSGSLAVITHGLEGNSRSSHVMGAAKALNAAGWDALAWNFRGCSGEPNRLLKSYHSGSTDDLELVLSHLDSLERYHELVLVGFSIGGNLVLKYLGERGSGVRSKIQAAVTFSVPCDLEDSADQLARPANLIYMLDFLRCLRSKVRAKHRVLPQEIDDHGFWRLRNFKDYDDRYTAPIHGFRDAHDYWRRCSSRQFLPEIRVPALIVNSLDDPFLGERCFPEQEALENPLVHLETPDHGGHLGFMDRQPDRLYWSELRMIEFVLQTIGSRAGDAAFHSMRPLEEPRATFRRTPAPPPCPAE